MLQKQRGVHVRLVLAQGKIRAETGSNDVVC